MEAAEAPDSGPGDPAEQPAHPDQVIDHDADSRNIVGGSGHVQVIMQAPLSHRHPGQQLVDDCIDRDPVRFGLVGEQDSMAQDFVGQFLHVFG